MDTPRQSTTRSSKPFLLSNGLKLRLCCRFLSNTSSPLLARKADIGDRSGRHTAVGGTVTPIPHKLHPRSTRPKEDRLDIAQKTEAGDQQRRTHRGLSWPDEISGKDNVSRHHLDAFF